MSYRTMALHRFVLRQCLPAATTLVRKTTQHQQRPVSVMVVLTTSAASTSLQQQTAHASMSTLAEPLDKTPLGTTATSTSASTASSSSSSSSASSLSSRQLHHTTTSEHASPLIAQDIYFNEHVKEGLGAMRRQHATQAATVADAMQQPDDDDNDNANDSSNASLQEEDRKALQILERSGHRHAATLTLIGYKGGIGDDQINQDRAVVISPFCRFEQYQQQQYQQQQHHHQPRSTTSTIDATQESCLLGVFDGHGPLGELVSDYSVSELPRLVARKLQAMERQRTMAYNTTDIEKNDHDDDDDMMIKQILIDSFVEIDKKAPAEKSGGCTASVILQLGNKLYVANAGDSRSFIVCYRKRTKMYVQSNNLDALY